MLGKGRGILEKSLEFSRWIRKRFVAQKATARRLSRELELGCVELLVDPECSQGIVVETPDDEIYQVLRILAP
jgi:hypothetical protein